MLSESSSTDTDTEPFLSQREFDGLQRLPEMIDWQSLADQVSPLPENGIPAQIGMGDVPAPEDRPMMATIGFGGPVPTQQQGYVLPHAPPSDLPPSSTPAMLVVSPAAPPAQVARPARFTSPVQPSGDRFVESAVNNSIPALEPWTGRHDFHVTVRTPQPITVGRQQPYVFDAEANKLYVDMNISVTVAFRVAEGTDTSRLRVSALPVYPDMHHVNTPVRRCPTHRQPEIDCNAGAEGHIDHVIRAEHDNAIYQEMGTTKERRSVVVPYERPPPGTDEYRVSYKFCCMNTCVGGINRRRLVVLFTLEDRSTGEARGRQTVEVKVCKCPHRDARADRIRRCPRQQPSPHPTGLPKRRRERPTAAEEASEPAARRRRLVIEVNDQEEYDHLMAVLESYRTIRDRLLERRERPARPTPRAASDSGESPLETPPPDVQRRPTLPAIKMEAE